MTCELTDGRKSVAWVASCLTDAVYDLLTATGAALKGQPGNVTFVEEPGCVILGFLPSGDRLRIDVSRRASWLSKDVAHTDRVERFELRTRTFAGSVLAALQQMALIDEPAIYMKKWRHEYPRERVKALQAALDERRD